MRTADAELKAQHDRGVEIQERLKVCRVAVDDLWTSMRLGERKVLVVQGLMDEAEVESSRCEGETERCNQELQIDDERMEMTDEQSRAVSKFKLYFNLRFVGVWGRCCSLHVGRCIPRRSCPSLS